MYIGGDMTQLHKPSTGDIMTEGRGTNFKNHQSLAMARLMKQYLSAFHRFSSDESIRYNFYIIKLLDSQQNIYKWERSKVEARAAQRFQSQQLRKLIIPDWINNWDSSFRYKMLSGAWYDQYKINILPHLQRFFDIAPHIPPPPYTRHISWSCTIIKIMQVVPDVNIRKKIENNYSHKKIVVMKITWHNHCLLTFSSAQASISSQWTVIGQKNLNLDLVGDC